jgi:tripartite-type tricarboxylate transporter receptor subunit TctC
VVAKKIYDAQRDFTPVGQIGYVPLIVAVNNDVPAMTMAEFVQLAKANPGNTLGRPPAWARPAT